MADVTDKKRLRQVQQQDLTESRLNDDFVFWLKTKGWNWLLGILVIACGYSFLNLYWQKRDQGRDTAWSELASAQGSGLPQSLALVASEHASTDSVALIAWLSAADAHLHELQLGQTAPAVATAPDGTPNPPEPLTADTRKITQDAADGFYSKVLDTLGSRKADHAMKPIAISALFGRAAIAESRGTMDKAKEFLAEAESLAGDAYPAFGQEAKRRAESLTMLASATELPSRASLPSRPDTAPLAPNVTDELTRSMTQPAPQPGAGQPPVAPAPVQPPQPDPQNPASTLGSTPTKPATPPATPPADPKAPGNGG